MKEYFGDCDNFCIQEGFIQIFDFTGGEFNAQNIVINKQLKHRYPAINIIKNKIAGVDENELILNEEEIIRLIIDGIIYEDCIELVTCSKREIEFPTIYINLSNQEIPIKISCIKNYQPPCKDRCGKPISLVCIQMRVFYLKYFFRTPSQVTTFRFGQIYSNVLSFSIFFTSTNSFHFHRLKLNSRIINSIFKISII